MVLQQRTVGYLLKYFDSLEQAEGIEVSWLYHNTQRLTKDSPGGATLMAVARLILKQMVKSGAPLPACFHAKT